MTPFKPGRFRCSSHSKKTSIDTLLLLPILVYSPRSPLSQEKTGKNRHSRAFTAQISHKSEEKKGKSGRMANLGVPIKLLHESLGHIITVELKTGEVCIPIVGVVEP